MKKAWFPSYPLSAQRRLWSGWADAQADLSLRWAHPHFVSFVMSRLRSFSLRKLERIRQPVSTLRWHHLFSRKLFKPRHEKTCLREFLTRSDSNWLAQLQKLAWGLKFWLQKLETLHYLGSEQQRRWSDCVDMQTDLRLCCSHMT